MKAPFPWFGGKRTVAADVWARFGEVRNYVEPFFGSGAVLLNRPGWQPEASWIETVNDRDGFVANFWRAVSSDPDLGLDERPNALTLRELQKSIAWYD